MISKELRTDAPEPRPGPQRMRVTLSLTPDEHDAWTKVAGECGMKLTRWAPIALNRMLLGIATLPAADKKGKVPK